MIAISRLLIIATLLPGATAAAGEGPPDARGAFYGEFTTVIILGSAVSAFEYRPTRSLSLSAGYGVAYFSVLARLSGAAHGPRVQAHLLAGGDSHNFEFALGGHTPLFLGEDGRAPFILWPSASIGYRYHPVDGGLMVRAGLAYTHGVSIGPSMSLGAAF